MHPIEVIEFMVIGVIIGVLLLTSIFLKGKWRKRVWALVVLFLVTYIAFYIARPYWIDAQIDKKVELLKPHLEKQYPNENWTITTVPHREEGYKHLNPYYIGVVFEGEPEVTYHYWVEKDNIYQISYTSTHSLD